jgi:hypothetical protein
MRAGQNWLCFAFRICVYLRLSAANDFAAFSADHSTFFDTQWSLKRKLALFVIFGCPTNFGFVSHFPDAMPRFNTIQQFWAPL